MLTDYCHNYAETLRMIMTIVVFSLHITSLWRKYSRSVQHLSHTNTSKDQYVTVRKATGCESQLRRHSLHQRTVIVFPFRACTSPVKHEMETSIISSPMKTIQPRRLCQPEGKCGLGLRQIYFVAWIQICTKPIVLMLLTKELSMEHLWFKW